MTPEDLLNRYPAFIDLQKRAKSRTPFFAWEYLDSATGSETAADNNRKAFDSIRLTPRMAAGNVAPDMKTTIMGQDYAIPIGVSPIGMAGLMWPGAEKYLAESAAKFNIPFCLSTVSCESIEDVGAIAGSNAWFQLYVLKDWATNEDLVKRASAAGFSTLVVTVDVPVPSMRERQRRAGLKMPPAITVQSLFWGSLRPAWAIETIKRGTPHFRNLVKYAGTNSLSGLSEYLRDNKDLSTTTEDIKKLRKIWKGALVVKGILNAEDAMAMQKAGADGIIVSNHGGRQFDGAPASISVLPQIAEKVNGKMAVMLDSGITGGLDIARACALGADFTFAGRSFMHGVTALGKQGASHASSIFAKDLENVMYQTSCNSLSDLRKLEITSF